MNIVDWHDLIARLSEPFPADQIKWRAGATNRDKTKAIALPYAEARAYEDRLNTTCPSHWHVDFQPWGDNRIICRLTIHNLTRSSTGEAGDANPDIAGTSAEAQAFKRACSKYGLGRYLYDQPTTWVDYDPKTKKLLSTPRLDVATPRPASTGIGTARAVAMHGHLTKIGFAPDTHFTFASSALGRPVTDFSTLEEPEARTIWTTAQRSQGPAASAS